MKRFASLLVAAFAGATAGLAQAAEPQTGATKSGARTSGAASLLQLDDGRSGRGNLIATTGIRGFSKPPVVTAHALIMTIGDYPSPIPKLKGVAHDAATATEIARRMGVPTGNIHTLRDGELTLEGMRRAFDALDAKLGGDDQVFIYYSGHGGRQLVQADGVERCAESLITADGKLFTDVEMESRLTRLTAKSQKTLVFLDACHSGGVTTRSVVASNAAYAPKSYTPPGLSCSKPSNVLTRSIAQPKPPGSGSGNFAYIAAARDSEVSLDQPGRGGVASQAWLACLSGAARDADGSGGLSASEVQACAQELINRKLMNAQGFLPHHVSITGNPSMVLSYQVPEASAPVPSAAPAPMASPAPEAIRPSALAALMDIYNNRDDRRLLTLEAPKPKLKIGRDIVDFTISSREGGHVYLLMVGSDGKTFDLLFPNQIDRNNQIRPGGTLRLPRPNWQLSAEGPAGTNMLLAIVTDNPRDFSAAGLKPAGPFSTVNSLAAKDIQLVTAGAATPAEPQCGNPASTRNLAIKQRCSTGYAAALLPIEEVQ